MAGLLGTQQPQRFGLLSPDALSMIQRGANGTFMPAHQPQRAPTRPRGQPGFLTQLLGGTEGLEAERARRRAEEMRPQMEAQRARMRAMAEQMGPAALIAFETNPEKFGENLAEQYAPQVIAAGGIQSVIGSGQRVSAPQVTQFGDSLVRTDPLRAAPETLMERGPTFSEQTARLNANNPVNVAPGAQLRDPRTGDLIASGAPRVFSAPDATQLYREDGGLMAENTRDAPPVDPVAAANQQRLAAATEQGRITMADNLQTGLTGARQFVESAGVWTHLMPWQRQSRANLEGHLETIKGNISFERLMEMKANSPNGASGLGALTDREARMLANTVGALDAEMSPQELVRSFATIDRLVAKMREQGAAPAAAPAAGRPLSPQEAAALPPGTRFIGMDGVERVRQ